MSKFKTPRTLITEYLESTKTQTVKPTRNRAKLTRTPDVNTTQKIISQSPDVRTSPHEFRSPRRGGRSPGRIVPHDRVSSLRGKHTRSMTSLTDENTPRTLIEGYLAGEETTAPAVRRLKRTSQSYSASQPVGSPAKRRALVQTNLLDPETETPRTLIQNYLSNATDVIETPVVPTNKESPDVSPTIPSVTGSGQYSTPSPFKTSSQSSGRSTGNITGSAKRSEPRKNKGKYHLRVENQPEDNSGSWASSSLSDIIEPTSPAGVSYHVPSPFRSSPESVTEVLVSQTQNSKRERLHWVPKASLNIPVLSQVGPTSKRSQQDEDSYSDFYDEEIIPETQSGSEKSYQEQHHVYDLPMKSGQDDGYDDDGINITRDFERSRHSVGRSRLSSVEGHRRASDFDQSRQITAEYSLDRLSNRSAVLRDDNESLEGEEKENVEMEFDERSNSSRASFLEKSTSSRARYDGEEVRYHERLHEKQRISSDGRNFVDDENFDRDIDDIHERHRARDGRWSEGHQLRENRQVRPGRYSEGQLELGQGQRLSVQSSEIRYLGVPGGYTSRSITPVSNRSESSLDLTPSTRKSRSSNDPNNKSQNSLNNVSSRRSRSAKDSSFEKLFDFQNELLSRSQRRGQSVQEEQEGRTHRYSSGSVRTKDHFVDSPTSDGGQGQQINNSQYDMDQDGYEERISPGSAHLHTLPDDTASFSPRVASTQRINTLPHHSPSARTSSAHTHGQSVSINVTSFSPRISSTQREHSFTEGGTTVLARTSHGRVGVLPDNTASFSPKVASTQRINTLPHHSPSGRSSSAHTHGQYVSTNVTSFSPSISSTQRERSFTEGGTTVLARTSHGRVGVLPDNTASFSPKVASTQRMYSTVGNMADMSPLDTVSPSPVVSPENESLSRTGTPGSSSRRQRKQTYSEDVEPSSPLDTVTPSPVVSPQRESLSSARLSGSQSLRTRTPITPNSSGQTPRSASLRSSKLSRGSWRRVSSSLEKKGNVSQRINNSTRRSSPRVSSAQLGRSVTDGSTTVIARKQQGQVQTVPDNTESFSPRMSSTQKMYTSVGQSHSESQLGEAMTPPPFVSTEGHDGEEESSKQQGRNRELPTDRNITNNTEKTKKPRRPREKSQYSMPVSVVKKDFTRYTGMRVSKEAIEEVMKASEVFWDNLASDLEAYAKHAGRKKIMMDDFILLFKRVGHITEKQCMNSLIEKYLPMEERQKLIPVARAYNRIEPKL